MNEFDDDSGVSQDQGRFFPLLSVLALLVAAIIDLLAISLVFRQNPAKKRFETRLTEITQNFHEIQAIAAISIRTKGGVTLYSESFHPRVTEQVLSTPLGSLSVFQDGTVQETTFNGFNDLAREDQATFLIIWSEMVLGDFTKRSLQALHQTLETCFRSELTNIQTSADQATLDTTVIEQLVATYLYTPIRQNMRIDTDQLARKKNLFTPTEHKIFDLLQYVPKQNELNYYFMTINKFID